ncbi:hypothetical protein ACLOJK_034513 [Asimina triloba]
MLIMKMVKEEKKNDRMFEFWHGYDELVLVKGEDTDIRLGYIGHQHLNDGLMPNVQVWMPTGSGNYVYDGGYMPMLVGWETSIEPNYDNKCQGSLEGLRHLLLGSSDEIMPKWWIVGQEEDPDLD